MKCPQGSSSYIAFPCLLCLPGKQQSDIQESNELTKAWLVNIQIFLEVRENIMQKELLEFIEEKLEAEFLHFLVAPFYFINLK